MLLAILQTTDAATNTGLAVVVLTQILRIGQYGFQELQWNDFHLHLLGWIVGKGSLVGNLVDARHTEVLDAVEISEILLTEGHPEAGTLDGGIIEDKALNLLVMEQVALARTDVRIGERLMELKRFGLYPLAILPIKSLLGYFADVYLGVEVGGKCLVVVAGIAIHDVEILYLVEVMLGGISCEDACHTGVETATQNGT